jgi:hypothetical protein
LGEALRDPLDYVRELDNALPVKAPERLRIDCSDPIVDIIEIGRIAVGFINFLRGLFGTFISPFEGNLTLHFPGSDNPI